MLAFLLACALGPLLVVGEAELVFSWTSVNYTWTNSHSHESYVQSDRYIVENNIITGVKFWNDSYYVTVPRWRPGVPSTLNKVVDSPDGPRLQPFPSWELQDYSSPANLWYCQSMEIDGEDIMWILDVGRLNIMNPTLTRNGVPKLVLFDMKENRILSSYSFPQSVASGSGSFLNDLAVDQERGVAYISDAIGDGGIVVYSRSSNTARRFYGPSTRNQPSVSMTIPVGGVDYGTQFNTPADGIALSADRDTLYYCALQGETLYGLPTAVLRNFALSLDEIRSVVVTLGPKPPSDGMAVASDGRLFFGGLTKDAVFEWNPSVSLTHTSAKTVSVNHVTHQWPDTFGFDGRGNLLFTTNRLQLFITNTMNFTDTNSPNMRIFRLPIGANSYLATQGPYKPQPETSSSSKRGASIGAVIAVGLSCLVLGLLVAACCTYQYFVGSLRKASSAHELSYTSLDDDL